MASIQERIQEASSRNSILLSGLHETGSAPSQLYHQIQYIEDLEAQIEQTTEHCQELQERTNIEFQEHKKYSESTFRRLAHKAARRGERFAEKAAKEERDYFEAVQEQKSSEDKLAYLRHLKAQAEALRAHYETTAQKHAQYQQDLDALYHSIFNGPTPGFPEEDEREKEISTANQHIQDLHRVLQNERHTLFLLRQIGGKLAETRFYLESAHDLSSMDMFGGGGSPGPGKSSSPTKRNHLEYAESTLVQVRLLQDSLRQFNPDLADLGPTSIPSASIWTDVVFDNVFTDRDMHDRIRESEVQVGRAADKCERFVKRQEEREKEVLGTIRKANDELKESRARLQKAREEAFRRVSGGEVIPGIGERTYSWTPGDDGRMLMSGRVRRDASLSEPPPFYSAG